MKLNFTRQPKKRMCGVRLTEMEYQAVRRLAKAHDESIGETIAVIVRAFLSQKIKR